MANIFDLYNDTAITEHTENVDSDGNVNVVISGLTPATTYDKFSLAYAGSSNKTLIQSFTTKAAQVVLVSSFKLDKTDVSGKVGENVKVTLSDLAPSNASNKKVNITSEDPSIVTVVDNGDSTYTLTFVKDGSTKVKWLAADGGGATIELPVTVSEQSAG